MFSPFLFIVYCLIVYRITSLIVIEAGPFDIFQRVRDYVGVDDLAETQRGFYPKLFSCSYCMSVWVAAVLWLPFAIFPSLFCFCLGFLAVSAVVMILHDLSQR